MDFSDTVVIKHLSLPPPCSVMVVDDDDLVRRHLVTLLEPAGYAVQSAASGAQALAALSVAPCQIVITDWEMPGMSGPALCRALRADDLERYTYLLVLTSRANPSDVLTGLAAGADDFLNKAASSAELLARMEVGRRIAALEQSLRASNAEHRRLSLTDALTGAHNRRSLLKFLPREMERSKRFDHSVAILSCDIDNFKRVNDQYGHDAGDEVLQAFVTRATACTRESIDWIARSGGEEFVVVLPVTTLEGAVHVAEKLRRATADLPIATVAGTVCVTVSIGVTALQTATELTNITPAALLRAADRCLYASKARGRNRVTCLTPAEAALLNPAGLAA